MITLPTAVTNGITGHSASLYVIRMEMEDAGVAKTLYVSSLPTGSCTFKYGGSTITAQTKYLGMSTSDIMGEVTVDGIGPIEYSMSTRNVGGVSDDSTTNVILLNQGRFNTEYSYDIENHNIEIYYGYKPPTGIVNIDSDMILRYKGVMKNVGPYDFSRFEIPCTDLRSVQTRLLPNKKISATQFPNASDSAIGKSPSIVIGDFYTNDEASHYNGMRNKDLVPGLCVDKYRLSYAICESSTSYLNTVNVAGGPIVVKSGDFQATVYTPVTGGFDNSSMMVTMSLISSSTDFRGALVGGGILIKPDTLGYYSEGEVITGTEWKKALNDDLTDYVLLSSPSSVSAAYFSFGKLDSSQDVLVKKGSLLGQGAEAYDAKIRVKVSNKTGIVYIQVIDKSTGYTSIPGTVGADGVAYFDVDYNTMSVGSGQITWDRLKATEAGVYPTVGSSVQLYDFGYYVRIEVRPWVDAIPFYRTVGATSPKTPSGIGKSMTSAPKPQKRVTEPNENIADVFCKLKGAPYSGSLVRNGNSYGSMIENPAYAVEYMLREMLGLTNIDTSSFDSVADARTSWKIATVINNRADALDHINSICQEFGMIMDKSSDGKYKLIALDSGSASFTIDSNNIMMTMGVPEITVSATNTDNVINSIRMKYRQDFTTNEMLEETYVADLQGDGTLSTNLTSDSGAPREGSYSAYLGDSISRYAMIKHLDFEAKHIRDKATSDLSVKKMIDWLGFKRIVITANLKYTQGMKLELGDIVKVNVDGLLPTVHNNSTGFMVTRIVYPVGRPKTPFVALEAEEIPNAYTGEPIMISRFIASEDLGVA